MYNEVKTFYIGIVDGIESQNIESFLITIGKAFKFPDYYGYNVNALLECLNDLSWLKEDNYILRIVNYSEFLKLDINEKDSMINLLKEVSIEWRNVPNYEGEQEYRVPSDFFVVID